MTEHESDNQTSSDARYWLGMTPVERYRQVERIVVNYRLFNELMTRIDFCDLYANEVPTLNPPCLAILGETGAGKTTLVTTWIARSRYKRYETPEGSVIPYLYVSIPAGATIKATASEILRALGDPNPERGTQSYLVNRVYHLLKGCRVRIIFVDEFQHIIEKETQQIIYKVADFLKDVINHTCIPMILIGRLGEAEPILMVNPQLEGRIGAPLYLEPFQWDRTKPETIAEFCQLMDSIDRSIPFDLSRLGTEEMAFRFYYASNGYLRYVMELIRYAASGAITSQCTTLNLPLLKAAYDARLAGMTIGNGKENPFDKGFHEARAKLVLPAPPVVPLPKPAPSGKSGQRSTTRRGSRQTSTKKLHTSEVLKK
jgi:TniB protein